MDPLKRALHETFNGKRFVNVIPPGYEPPAPQPEPTSPMSEREAAIEALADAVEDAVYGSLDAGDLDELAAAWHRYVKAADPAPGLRKLMAEKPPWESSGPPRAQALDRAKELITGDRNETYGPPGVDFARQARMLTALEFTHQGDPIQPHHIAMIMTTVKLARLVSDPTHVDSYIDGVGYMANGFEVRPGAEDTQEL